MQCKCFLELKSFLCLKDNQIHMQIHLKCGRKPLICFMFIRCGIISISFRRLPYDYVFVVATKSKRLDLDNQENY